MQANVAVAIILIGEHEIARRHVDRAIRLNPNDPGAMKYALAAVNYIGEHKKARDILERLTLQDPLGDAVREISFDVHYMNRDFEAAVAAVRGWRIPPPHMLAEMAAGYAMAGMELETTAATEAFKHFREEPEKFIRTQSRMCALPEDVKLWLEGYRRAGFAI